MKFSHVFGMDEVKISYKFLTISTSFAFDIELKLTVCWDLTHWTRSES